MIKKLRVTVDGKPYEVTVEIPNEPGAAAPIPPPSVSAPAPPPPPAPVAQSSTGPGEVRSPLAGRIIAINVQPGQAVIVAKIHLGIPFGIACRLCTFRPSITVAVQRDALDAKSSAALFELRGTVS